VPESVAGSRAIRTASSTRSTAVPAIHTLSDRSGFAKYVKKYYTQKQILKPLPNNPETNPLTPSPKVSLGSINNLFQPFPSLDCSLARDLLNLARESLDFLRISCVLGLVSLECFNELGDGDLQAMRIQDNYQKNVR
jgi:hypothetical protein